MTQGNKISKDYTILIAEDEELNYVLLAATLRNISRQYTILRAENGKEAIEYCLANPLINLVFMDIKMPIVDGYTATKQIKNARPSLPVIAQTAYASTESREMAKDAGCDFFLAKPINMGMLCDVLEEYLPI